MSHFDLDKYNIPFDFNRAFIAHDVTIIQNRYK